MDRHSDDILSLSKDETHCIRQCLKEGLNGVMAFTANG